jgi:microcystin-dependent protein
MKDLPYLVAGAASFALTLFFVANRQAQSSLLPFQRRLTDATGVAVPDGAKVVEFKIYDAPTGGTVKWAGEVHKLSVNGGLINTMLGSKSSLGGVDFSAPRYLQITLDVNGDGLIRVADPPLLPRQSVVPAVFATEACNALDSDKLAGANWSAVLVDADGAAVNDPSAGFINGAKIWEGSIDGAKLAAGSVSGGTGGSITDGSVTKEDLGTGVVASEEIEDGFIQAGDLALGLQNSVTSAGAVVTYAETVAPPGWELRDARAVGRADPKYSGVFAVIGTTHGSGNGTTTFNVPDYRGRFLRGADDADGSGGTDPAGRDPEAGTRVAMAAGGLPGGAVGSIQDDQLKSHTHALKLGGDVAAVGGRPQRTANYTDNGTADLLEAMKPVSKMLT